MVSSSTVTVRKQVKSFDIHDFDAAATTRTCESVLDAQEERSFVEDGYIQLPIRWDDGLVDSLREVTDAILTGGSGHYGRSTKGRRTSLFYGDYIRHAHLHDARFHDLLIPAFPLVDTVRCLIGPRVRLRSYSVRVTQPGTSDETSWHSDFRPFVSPQPPIETGAPVLTALVYLDDADNETGALFVRPGSHKLAAQPDREEAFGDLPDQIELQPRAGDTVLIASTLWHRGGPNLSAERARRVAILIFAPFFFRSAALPTVSPCIEFSRVVEQAEREQDEAILELFGQRG